MAVSCNISDLGVSGPRGESAPTFWLLDGKLETERGEDEEEEEEEMATTRGEATVAVAAGVAALGETTEAAEARGEMAEAAAARGDFGLLGPRGEGVFVFVEEDVVDVDEEEVVEARESLALMASCSAEVPRGLLYSTEVGTSLSSLSSFPEPSSSSEPDS